MIDFSEFFYNNEFFCNTSFSQSRKILFDHLLTSKQLLGLNKTNQNKLMAGFVNLVTLHLLLSTIPLCLL